MIPFDIPINIRVNANTEEDAEAAVSKYMERLLEHGVLASQFINWDFIEFVSEDELEGEDDGLASIGI